MSKHARVNNEHAADDWEAHNTIVDYSESEWNVFRPTSKVAPWEQIAFVLGEPRGSLHPGMHSVELVPTHEQRTAWYASNGIAYVTDPYGNNVAGSA
jgi:hypothetical protein